MSRLIDAEPIRHGHWISVDEEKKFYLRKCSECHTLFAFIDRYHYCPNCGAKMDFYETRRLVKQDKDIVQCKDCKYWKKCIEDDYCNYWEEYCWIPAMEDDFCSRGEKK